MRQLAVGSAFDLVEVVVQTGDHGPFDKPTACKSHAFCGSHGKADVNGIVWIKETLTEDRVDCPRELGKQIRL